MSVDPNLKIAGGKRAADWLALRKKLVKSTDQALWREAGTEYFHERIDTRYIKPIHAILSRESKNGEGFSITTLQCALLEFLAATVAGQNYRFPKPLNGFEYVNSRKLFEEFLVREAPFAGQFTEQAAGDFYASVRCGLLHEAQTKNGWIIRTHKTGMPMSVDTDKKVLYRHRFQLDLELFIKTYRERLCVERPLQEGFIRKFDHICGLEPAGK